jgi:hypothetical protein
MRVIDVLESLKNYAIEYKKSGIIKSLIRNSHMNEVSKDIKITNKEVDAVIVDFINYIAMMHGVDYALYTKDLTNEKKMSALTSLEIQKIVDTLEDQIVTECNVQLDSYEEAIEDIIKELEKRYREF